MNPRIKALWIAALRSGKYHQTKGELRTGDRFCCLGVLCNLHALEHPAIAAKETSPRKYLGRSGVLPDLVADWAGVRERSPGQTNEEGLYGDGTTRSLAADNDNGHSFSEIADTIARHF